MDLARPSELNYYLFKASARPAVMRVFDKYSKVDWRCPSETIFWFFQLFGCPADHSGILVKNFRTWRAHQLSV